MINNDHSEQWLDLSANKSTYCQADEISSNENPTHTAISTFSGEIVLLFITRMVNVRTKYQ